MQCAMKRDVLCIVMAFIVLAVAVSIYAVFEYTDEFPVTQRGFFCDDPSIRYPRHKSTVPGWIVLLFFFILPAVVLSIADGFLGNRHTSCYTLIHFTFAFCMSGLLCDSIKLVVGRLRPYFLTICLPGDLLNKYCGPPTTTGPAANRYVDIDEYKCNKTEDKAELYKARKSFPSGHTTTSVFGAVFICIYVWKRLPSRPPYWLRHVIVSLVLILAIMVAVTRIKDYKHHPEDVMVGALIGGFFGAFGGLVWRSAIEAHSPEPAAHSAAKREDEETLQLHAEGESPRREIA